MDLMGHIEPLDSPCWSETPPSVHIHFHIGPWGLTWTSCCPEQSGQTSLWPSTTQSAGSWTGTCSRMPPQEDRRPMHTLDMSTSDGQACKGHETEGLLKTYVSLDVLYKISFHYRNSTINSRCFIYVKSPHGTFCFIKQWNPKAEPRTYTLQVLTGSGTPGYSSVSSCSGKQ